MQRLSQQKALDNYLDLLANERSETERLFILKVLERKKAETSTAQGEDRWSLEATQNPMADPELLRLEKILLQARARLDRITGSFSDPTVLKGCRRPLRKSSRGCRRVQGQVGLRPGPALLPVHLHLPNRCRRILKAGKPHGLAGQDQAPQICPQGDCSPPARV